MIHEALIPAACDLIKRYHPFKSNPVLSETGEWYYGYGFKVDGEGLILTQVSRPIQLCEAQTRLEASVQAIIDVFSQGLHQSPSRNRLLALISFTHDVGIKSLNASDIIPALNHNDPHLALKELERGIYIRKRGALMVCPHKSKRRKYERYLWVTPDVT